MSSSPTLLLWLLFAFAGLAWSADGLDAPDCNLTEAPADAGYYVFLGMRIQVHPPPSSIGAAYDGCQSMWLAEDDDKSLALRVLFRGGVPVLGVGTAVHERYPLKCTPRVRGNATAFACDEIDMGLLPLPSLPKSCLMFRSSPADSSGFYIAHACR